MTKEDLIRKLTSRKFWVAMVGFITGLIMMFGVAEDKVHEIGGLMLTFGSMVSYIFGESWADASPGNVTTSTNNIYTEEPVGAVLEHFD